MPTSFTVNGRPEHSDAPPMTPDRVKKALG
jgi:hypothetical protein